MASAAVQSAPPGETMGTPYSDGSADPAGTGDVNGADDEDDDVIHSSKRRNARAADQDGDDDADLFGDGDDGEDGADGTDSKRGRGLDDSELDSGDDIGRGDRAGDVAATSGEDVGDDMDVINTMQADLGVHPGPDPSDGELYLLKVPKFLAFEPAAFDADQFRPPTTDLHSDAEPTTDFSAHKVAMKTIRWRRIHKGAGKLQSNGRVLRWSDGSLTLQIANEPGTQYLLPGNTLAPPQHAPSTPTPTSTGGQKRKGMQQAVPYSAEKDAFTYLAAPSESAALLRVTNKVTTALQVVLPRDASEDAVKRLRDRIEQSQHEAHSLVSETGQLDMIEVHEDPELGKKRAELAEKERMKAQRKRENQEMKNSERGGRGGGGGRRTHGGGLNVNSLETGDDELGMGVPRRAGGAGRAKPKRQRRGEIYSDDEEAWGKRGRTKEDEYDEEDDFLAPSDEEEEVQDEDEDIDEGITLGEGRSRKRASPTDEQDAEGEPDEDDQAGAGSPTSRVKRRRVIDEDEEDEEE